MNWSFSTILDQSNSDASDALYFQAQATTFLRIFDKESRDPIDLVEHKCLLYQDEVGKAGMERGCS